MASELEKRIDSMAGVLWALLPRPTAEARKDLVAVFTDFARDVRAAALDDAEKICLELSAKRMGCAEAAARIRERKERDG